MRYLRGLAYTGVGLLCGMGLAALAAYGKQYAGNMFVAALADAAVEIFPVFGVAAGLLAALMKGGPPPDPPAGA